MSTGIGIGVGIGPFLDGSSGGPLSLLDWYVVAKQRDGSDNLTDQTGGGLDLDMPGGSNDPLVLGHTGTDYLRFPGTNGNYLSIPDSNELDITGDLEIIVHARLDDWAASGQQSLLQKLTTAYLVQQNASNLQFGFHNGTSYASFSFAHGLSGAVDKWVKFTLDVDNGASGHDVSCYLSDDGSDWTQVGATQTTAGVVSVSTNTSIIRIGDGGGGAFLSGRIYRAIVKDGIDGTVVLDVQASDADPDSTTFTESSANAATVTINRTSSGYKLAVVQNSKIATATDDYMATSSDGLFSVAADEDATLIWVGTVYGTATSGGLGGVDSDGLSLALASGSQYSGHADDGANDGTETSAGATRGARVALAVQIDRTSNELRLYVNGTLQASPVDASSIGALSGDKIELGRVVAAYTDAEHEAMGFALSSLTATQISDIGDALIAANAS